MSQIELYEKRNELCKNCTKGECLGTSNCGDFKRVIQMEYNKKYLIYETKQGCRGIEGAIVKRLNVTGLVDKEHYIVKVITEPENPSCCRIGEIWRINSDCRFTEIQ